MNTAAPKWFVAVAVVALLWNLAGCAAIFHDAMMSAEDVAALPPDMKAVHSAREGWMVIGSLVAVVAGALGSLGLALKRRWALPVLIVSLLGLLVQDIGFVLIAQKTPIPFGGWAMQGVVLLIAIALVLLARKASTAGWLR